MSGPSCLLFFPGTRAELLPKALASAAGLVCLDLEDAVRPEAKARARAGVVELLDAVDRSERPRLVVRVNHPSTADGVRDLEALAKLGLRPADEPRSEAGDDATRPPAPSAPKAWRPIVMVPKVSGRAEIVSVRRRLAAGGVSTGVIAMIETAAGLSRVEEIAETEGVLALLFGGVDLSGELGCALEWEPLLYARSRCVLAARLAGVGLIDTPHFAIDDCEGLLAEARRARDLGFTGKAAIHPRQVPAIEEAFIPTDEELAAAHRVIEAYERSGQGAFALDGAMVDRPVVEAARRVVRRAEGVRRPREPRDTRVSDRSG